MNEYIKVCALIFVVIFNICVFSYLSQDCNCSVNTKLELIKFYVFLSLVVNIFLIYVYFFNQLKFDIVYKYAMFILIPCTIIYTYTIILYINELKEKECECMNLIIMKLISYLSVFTSFTLNFLILIGILSFWFIKNAVHKNVIWLKIFSKHIV